MFVKVVLVRGKVFFEYEVCCEVVKVLFVKDCVEYFFVVVECSEYMYFDLFVVE